MKLEKDAIAQATALLGAASRTSGLETKAVYTSVARGVLDRERERLTHATFLLEAQEAELVRRGETLAPLTPDAAHGDKVDKT